jgi:hypothetical protein
MGPMPSLRDKLAQHGFESNDDYEFQVRCLLSGPPSQVRALNIVGDGERRKTAFANALAAALSFPQILYHDFAECNPEPPEVILPPSRDEMGRSESPVAPADETISKACALSEAEPTVLILDQLHRTDFRDHMRIHRLVRDALWQVRDARYFANPNHLLLFLISEEPLYHALQKASFRIWISRLSERQLVFTPQAFGLAPEAAGMLEALGGLFAALDMSPVRSEVKAILNDIRLHVRTTDHLRHCLYGRTEGIERQALFAANILPYCERVLTLVETFVGAEHIEIGGD